MNCVIARLLSKHATVARMGSPTEHYTSIGNFTPLFPPSRIFLDQTGQGFYQLPHNHHFLYSSMKDCLVIQSTLTFMIVPSCEKPSLVRQKVLTLCFFVILAVGIQGCSDSDDTASPTTQEKPAPTTSAIAPKDAQAPSSTGEQGNASLPVPTPEPSRQPAQEELDHATFAIEKAEQLLRRAPMGKESDLALTALQRDLDSARNLLRTGQTHFDEQKFEMAKTQAHQATEKASAVYEHIEQAISTVNVDSR